MAKIDWTQISEKLDEWRGQMTDEKNHLTLDFETYYSDSYSLRKKDMTLLKYIHHSEFKLQSMAFGWGRTGEIEYVEDKHVAEAFKDIFVKNNTIVMLGQNLLFDGLVAKYRCEGIPHMYLDLLGMSRAMWPHEQRHDLGAILKRIYPNDSSMRKGDELGYVKGKVILDAQDHTILKPYNIRDIVTTRAPIYKLLDAGFPVDELLTQDILIKMACKPPFKADVPLLERTYLEAKIRQEDAVDNAYEFMCANSKIDQAFFLAVEDRNTDVFKTQKAYIEQYRMKFGGMPPIKKTDEFRKFLTGNDKFAYYLREAHNVAVRLKDSPTPLNPYNETWALSKNDVEFQELMAENRDLAVLWEGRLLSKSNMDKTRAETLLFNASVCDNWLIIVIKYGAAHTHRFGGGEKINPQNFGRGSNHRKALRAPKGMLVSVADSSNIESRMSAWFCDFFEKLDLFEQGGDPYNAMATDIFGFPVDRKSKTVDHKMEGMVGKSAELGCGYQMGAPRFKNFLNAGPMGMPPIFLEDIASMAGVADPYGHVVKTFRRTNYPIRNMWRRLETVLEDMTNPNCNYTMNGIRILYKRIQLPSGLCLHYPQLGRRRGDDGKYQWSYRGKLGFTNIFGGKLLENIIQALARCVVVEQMLWIAAYLSKFENTTIAMQVHDEVVSIIPDEEGLTDEIQEMIEELMRQSPDWCESAPLDAEGGYADNYSK